MIISINKFRGIRKMHNIWNEMFLFNEEKNILYLNNFHTVIKYFLGIFFLLLFKIFMKMLFYFPVFREDAESVTLVANSKSIIQFTKFSDAFFLTMDTFYHTRKRFAILISPLLLTQIQ